MYFFFFLLERAFISLSVLLPKYDEYPAAEFSGTDAYCDIWDELVSLSTHRHEMHLASVHKSQLYSQMCFRALPRLLGAETLLCLQIGALLNYEV